MQHPHILHWCIILDPPSEVLIKPQWGVHLFLNRLPSSATLNSLILIFSCNYCFLYYYINFKFWKFCNKFLNYKELFLSARVFCLPYNITIKFLCPYKLQLSIIHWNWSLKGCYKMQCNALTSNVLSIILLILLRFIVVWW